MQPTHGVGWGGGGINIKGSVSSTLVDENNLWSGTNQYFFMSAYFYIKSQVALNFPHRPFLGDPSASQDVGGNFMT